MLATPRNHGRVSGTDTMVGTAMTSPASARRISQRSPAHDKPSRVDSTCAAVLETSRAVSSCWKVRRSSLALTARAMMLSSAGPTRETGPPPRGTASVGACQSLHERVDLAEELVAVD